MAVFTRRFHIRLSRAGTRRARCRSADSASIRGCEWV